MQKQLYKYFQSEGHKKDKRKDPEKEKDIGCEH